MLKLGGVSSGYGKLQFSYDVSIEADIGRLTVVMRPNVSGKSTLLETIIGLTIIYSGTISLDGKDLHVSLHTKSQDLAWPTCHRPRPSSHTST